MREKNMTKNKILAIIYRKKDGNVEFLALRNNPIDPIHGGDFYYVVTGGVEENEELEDAVKREIQEETGIEKNIGIKNTGKILEYKHPGEGDILCKEFCFLVEVEGEVQNLSNEHVEYKWLEKKDFVEIVKWYTDKKELKNMIKDINYV